MVLQVVDHTGLAGVAIKAERVGVVVPRPAVGIGVGAGRAVALAPVGGATVGEVADGRRLATSGLHEPHNLSPSTGES